jgi:hypothetical protein
MLLPRAVIRRAMALNDLLSLGVDPMITPAPDLLMRQAPTPTDPAFIGYWFKDVSFSKHANTRMVSRYSLLTLPEQAHTRVARRRRGRHGVYMAGAVKPVIRAHLPRHAPTVA